jgi:pyruvate,water dikinase
MKEMKLQDPHTVKGPEGCEGWEEMYPYQYLFTTVDPERTAYEKNQLWVQDSLHTPEPLFPFDVQEDEQWWCCLSQMNTRVWLVPAAKGLDHRMLYGYTYINPIMITDPAEIEKRIPVFMRRAGYYFQNWEKMTQIWVQKCLDNARQIDSLVFEELPEIVDESLVTNFAGVYPSYHLISNYLKLLDIISKAWQYHFEGINLGFAAEIILHDFCEKAFPGITRQTTSRFTASALYDMFKPDLILRDLAKLARESKLDDVILEPIKWDALEEKLKRSKEGKEWLAKLENNRDPWFYMMIGSGLAHDQPCWNDDLNIPLEQIRAYIQRLKRGEDLSLKDFEQVKRDRDEFTGKYRNLLNTEEDKRTFDQLLGAAQVALPTVENHGFWLEFQHFARMNRKIRDLGRIFTNNGMLGDPEDIWYLHRVEILYVLQDLINAWGTGTKPAGTWYLPPKIKRRKELMHLFKAWTPPAMLGALPEKITEPFIQGLWGITNQTIKDWAEVIAKDKVTQLKGFAASPGKAEGTVRVIRNPSEIDQIKDGEILVCPTTSPNWGPAFNTISACVTDIGGVMSHAALVCRNFELPAVTGTGFATKKLKNGDRVRVDGDAGTVTVI